MFVQKSPFCADFYFKDICAKGLPKAIALINAVLYAEDIRKN